MEEAVPNLRPRLRTALGDFVIVCTCLGLLAGFFYQYAHQVSLEDQKDLMRRVTGLEQNVAVIKANVDTIKGEYNSKSSQLDRIETKVDAQAERRRK